jgi:nucleoside-diphosphate-sugar epimerase
LKSKQSKALKLLKGRFQGQKWAIIGATGWVGSNLVQFARDFEVDFELFGSSSRIQEVAGIKSQIHSYDATKVIESDYDFIWDCAFVTRDQLLSNPARASQNENLIENLKTILRENTFGRLVYFSSGATISPGLSEETYGKQKSEAENLIKESAVHGSIDALIMRLWNVSGPHCTKRQEYALTSMIDQALMEGQINIRSRNYLWRRFAALNDVFLAALLSPKDTLELDSGGVLIEIRQLAKEIMKVLDMPVKIVDSLEEETHTVYASWSLKYELTLLNGGFEPSSINEQIVSSI